MADTSPPFEVEPELPPVPILPAEGLSLLRDIVINLWIEWTGDPDEKVDWLMDVVKDILIKPLFKFDEGYTEFVKQLNAHAQTNEVHDMWRIMQLTLFTELGKDRENMLNDFVLMVRRIMNESPDGDKLFIKSIQKQENGIPVSGPEWLGSVRNNLSMLALLLIKVYVTSVRVKVVKKEPGK